ncbi:hypothetical protein LOK49_LG11G00117 [Camellia lanceoleosa]|uniref:Uncharacterized protein n=1 Tax=Camellia lanceoleosa TaxID=1840588 RepID=A0ACC0G244_9ERIC|nr:hypothetical protein LOK49_LG11G00117 [Camellia lanceoleosa]
MRSGNSVDVTKAQVKIIKCLVENIVVDISFNQLGGLCTLCFLEEVDHLINQNHLFKRSIILIKAWCYYESRVETGGNPESSTEVCLKIPVISKMNFVAVVKETDCFFLIVLKRTRRNRRPKPKQKQRGGGSGVEFVDYLLEKLFLLRRNQPELNNLGHYNQIASPDLG